MLIGQDFEMKPEASGLLSGKFHIVVCTNLVERTRCSTTGLLCDNTSEHKFEFTQILMLELRVSRSTVSLGCLT
jgi:hypothetical protein